jgi:hypothetical protein
MRKNYANRPSLFRRSSSLPVEILVSVVPVTVNHIGSTEPDINGE